MPIDKRHVVIVGGGISGLSVAFFLSQMASQDPFPLKITLLESRERFGGVLRTWDRPPLWAEAGADAFYGGGSRGAEAVALCQEAGLSGELVDASPCFRRFFILKGKEFIPAPGSLSAFTPAALLGDPALSFSAKLRLLLEPWVPRRQTPGDESLGHFVRRRLGTAFYKERVGPLIQGVYMADPETLSLETVFPDLRKREEVYGSLTRAAWADRSGKKGRPEEKFLSLKGGLESLCTALVRRLGSHELRVSCPVSRVEKDGAGLYLALETGETVRADAICLAMNSSDVGRMLRGAAPGLSKDLESIRYDSVLTFNLVFPAQAWPSQVPAFGFLAPADNGTYPFSSLKWFDHPADRAYRCFRIFISEAMLPGVFGQEEGTVQEKILKSLEELFGIRTSPAVAVRERYRQALPRYEVGHGEKIARIEAGLEKYPGLFLTGNGFRGFGITDCIHAARETARKIFVYGKNPNHVE